NFGSGRALDPPLRASGSQQLDATVLADVVNRIADSGPELRRLLIVDLRQESHAFLDGRAVSWCADKDWSNVGQPPAWITRDEQCQLVKLAAAPDTLVYAGHKDADGNLQILGSRPLHVAPREHAPARLVGPRPRIHPEPSAADLPLRPQAQPVGQTLAGAAERDPLAKVGFVPPIRVRRLRGGPTIAGVLELDHAR